MALILFLIGHDTTASAMSWILYNLAKHPEHQTKIQDELDALHKSRQQRKSKGQSQGQNKGQVQNSGFKVKWDHLTRMPYLTMCIKESLRLHPPTPFISRQITKATRLDEKYLPRGATVNICIYGLHHNATVWGADHMEYKPERFSAENSPNIDPHAFLPFSAGPRNCIGQHFAMNEIKTVLAKLLFEFKIRLDTSHKVEMVAELNLRAKNGIKVFFEKREEIETI